MVGAAMATMPRHTGTLRGSEASAAAGAAIPGEPEITKSLMQEMSGQVMTHEVISTICSQIAVQIVGQLGWKIATAVYEALTGTSCATYYYWNKWDFKKCRKEFVFTETNFLN